MTTDKPFLILKAGSLLPLCPSFVDTFGDTEHTFLSSSGLTEHTARTIDIEAGAALPASPHEFAGIMVSGSAAMVSTEAPWMLESGRWLRRAIEQDVPVLGICFGHQLLAHALGGVVGKNPAGLEGGTVEVEFDAGEDPLFGAMPGRADLQVHHYETVLEPPAGSQVLARSERDRFQVLRHAPRAWGVQFHPELTMPMMEVLMDTLATEDDPHGHAGMRDTLRPTPEGPNLLRRFVSFARG